jgi:hypothetical protein
VDLTASCVKTSGSAYWYNSLNLTVDKGTNDENFLLNTMLCKEIERE